MTADGNWLSTSRLTLRRPVAADVDAAFVIHSDARTYEHVPDQRMRTRDDAQTLLDAWQTHWERCGFGYASVRRRGLDKVIGFAGVKVQAVAGHDVLNLYYRFAPEAWGHGYAGEAATALVEWSTSHHAHRPVIARVARHNPRSIRTASAAGLELTQVQDPRDPVPHWIYCSRPLTS